MERIRKAEEIYRRLEKRLLKNHAGEYLIVEPGSGDYFLGKDEVAVARRALKAHPGKTFGIFKIGAPAAHLYTFRLKS